MMANEETISIINNHQHEQEQEQLVYDVFLSFNASDTGHSFTGNLFNALRRKRFKTFMDKDGIKSGHQILASTFEALEASKIAVVVFSENYAASSYCLNYLVKILECRNRIKQRVLPIFYDVDPSHVRHQTGTFGSNFDSLKYNFEDEKLQKWKSALYEVGSLSGFRVQGYRCEYQSIEVIVNYVFHNFPRINVFLSFSEDTRYSFTGYLYNALKLEEFNIFMEGITNCMENLYDKSLPVDKIIEHSRLSIIVFSENYAYSSSCLDELVSILHFMKKNNKFLVLPIFYKVEPTDIRYQKNNYEKAMNKHENDYGQDSEKVKIWRSALFEVANLTGWHFKSGYEYEYELVEKIVEEANKI